MKSKSCQLKDNLHSAAGDKGDLSVKPTVGAIVN